MRVVVLDDHQQVALASADWSPVTARAEVVAHPDHVADRRELAERLAGAEVVVVMRERTAVDEALLSALPDLRLIVTTGPVNAAVDVAAARARGVTVCGTGGYIEQTVELTWALILGLARHLADEAASVRSGGWQTALGTDLHGKTLGVVGLGRIGSRVARVGTAFGMRVVAWSEHLTEERAREAGAQRVAKDELLAAADVLTVHLVLSERSRGVIGATELAGMRPSALLVNTSRGPLVDEQALAAALADGTIAGAALDVFEEEPLPAGHPFRTLPNVLATPHVGYVTAETYELFYREVVQDIVAFWDGRPVREVRQ